MTLRIWVRRVLAGRRGTPVAFRFTVLILLTLSLLFTVLHRAAGRRENAVEVAQLRSILIASVFEETGENDFDTAMIGVQEINGVLIGKGLMSIGFYDMGGRWLAADKVRDAISAPIGDATVLETSPAVLVAVPVRDKIVLTQWNKRILLDQPWMAERLLIIILGLLLVLGIGRNMWRERAARDTKFLRQRMTRFLQTGEHEPQTEVDHMSPDLARLYSAFDEMAASSVADVKKAKQSTVEKAVLIREVHHRVKNNLQMMSSILSMHIRDTQNPEMIAVLRRVQGRVISLATVHTDLYQSSIAGEVPVAPLLNEIADRAEQVAVSLGQPLTIDRRIEVISLFPDQVVPLSLLTAEALNVALSDALPLGQTPDAIAITFRSAPDLTLIIEVKAQNLKTSQEPSIGKQLMQAFATQLNATFTEMHDDDRLSLRFAFEPID